MRSINSERKKLSLPNRDIFDDMNMYLLSKNINDLIRKDILLDILGLFQENEKRGIAMNEVIDNYESFCDEIARNSIQKTKWELILSFLMKIGMIFLIVIIYSYVLMIFSGQQIRSDYLSISSDFIGYLIAVSIGTLLASNIRGKLTYRLPFGKWYIYAFVLFIIYGLCTIFTQYVVDSEIKVSIYTIIVIVIFNVVICSIYYSIRNANYKKYINSK